MIYDKDDENIKKIETLFKEFKQEDEYGNRKNLYIDKIASGKDVNSYIIVLPMSRIEFDDYDSILKNCIVIEGYKTTSKYNEDPSALVLLFIKEITNPLDECDIVLLSDLEED